MKLFSRVLLIYWLCCVGGYGTSYDYQPLDVPKAEDIVAFTNGLPPSTGDRITKKKEEILQFLRYGKKNLDVSSWYDLEYPDRGGRLERLVSCEGVFVDKKGQFYFWFWRSPKVLKLVTPDGRYALLELRK
jgi:hypothetical protein